MEVTVLNGQSPFDVALQAAGSLEAVFDIFADLDGLRELSITEELSTGTRLLVPAVANKQVADYYRVNAIKPATAIGVTDAPMLQEGVEFWLVEYDFHIKQ
jgi:hypothetical protein